MTNGRDLLIAQVRECFGRVAYSHKTHEKQADLYFRRHRALKRWQIALSALTTTGIIATLFGAGRFPVVAAAIVSTILTALTAYTKDHDHAALAQQHGTVASALWTIRESYLSLLTDLVAQYASIETAQLRRDALQKELGAIYANAPRTEPKAYAAAQRGLQVSEDLTFSDTEIDSMLPAALRALPKA